MGITMKQQEKAVGFAKLHSKSSPLVLYNAWDAGSAKAVLEAGATAIATSSWSVAAAHGYGDGEAIPLDFVQQIVGRITATVDVPVTVDFEGGYSDDDATLAKHISDLLHTGIIGINFEDRVVQGKGLYPIERQAKRIAAIRSAAKKKHIDLFINARTDLFFEDHPEKLMAEGLERAKAYAAAGASGFFIPGLADDALIKNICDAATLPVNVMVMDGVSPAAKLAEIGVSRISFGPIPYVRAMETVTDQAKKPTW
jgi:2-methylisocitrate lyase-like PEP mutase family enzyme